MRGWRPGCVDLGNWKFCLSQAISRVFFVRDHNVVIRTSPAQNDNNSNTMLCAVCCCFVRGNMVDKWLCGTVLVLLYFYKQVKQALHLFVGVFIYFGSNTCSCIYFVGVWGWWDGETANGKAVGNQTKVCFQHTIHIASHTNRRNKGWTSADRSTKATLMLTVPRPLVKSSTKDLTRPTFVIAIRRTCPFNRQCRQSIMLTRKLLLLSNIGRGEYRRLPAWILT